jgi:hypothetical protein
VIARRVAIFIVLAAGAASCRPAAPPVAAADGPTSREVAVAAAREERLVRTVSVRHAPRPSDDSKCTQRVPAC